MRPIIGIDPGKSGAIAYWTEIHGNAVVKMPDGPAAIVDLLRSLSPPGVVPIAYMELVSGYMGNDFGTSANGFVFGRNCGIVEGILAALSIPLIKVMPAKWQRDLGVAPMGTVNGRYPAHLKGPELKLAKIERRKHNGKIKRDHKGRLKDLAQELNRDISVTLSTSDALLILQYAKVVESGNGVHK